MKAEFTLKFDLMDLLNEKHLGCWSLSLFVCSSTRCMSINVRQLGAVCFWRTGSSLKTAGVDMFLKFYFIV